MADVQHNARLNELLIDLGRSLLQYVWESSPWTNRPELTTKLTNWARQQQRDVAKLVALLDERGWPIDFGVYPVEYTDLQFLSLDFLLPHLAVSQQRIVIELDEAVHTCADDPLAFKVLQEILVHEKQITEEIREACDALCKVEPAIPGNP